MDVGEIGEHPDHRWPGPDEDLDQSVSAGQVDGLGERSPGLPGPALGGGQPGQQHLALDDGQEVGRHQQVRTVEDLAGLVDLPEGQGAGGALVDQGRCGQLGAFQTAPRLVR